jgi:hypothetical protein
MNFLTYLRSIQVEKHLLKGRRGSEENLKIKLVIPLLEHLGWDVLRDMDFEHKGADIVLIENDAPAIIIETKDWAETLENHLNQCLEYTLKMNTPWVLVSSGSRTALYSSLLNRDDLRATRPLMDFTFHELTGVKGQAIIDQLYSLIGKESFTGGHAELNKIISALATQPLTKTYVQFQDKASNYMGHSKSKRMTEEEFIRLAREKGRPVSEALEYVYREIRRFEGLNEKINIQFRSVEIGFNYRLDARPRPKNLNLFGVNPKSASIAFWWDTWKILGISDRTHSEIVSYPRQAQSRKWAEDLIVLLIKAIGEIHDSTERKGG